ncbi:MAG: rhodanese-like domain-containing protein [Candidatus Thermoplasmatota archaeon]|nr:rhodanese-like domain-containing protein [Candidatus Thermoplasmatota archaeon]
MAGHITNIAGYRFIALDDLDRLQSVMRSLCTDLGLKGTVLLATEGINFFLAGTATAVEGFTAFLDGDERFHGIPVKTSFTDYPPFNRLNVRKKSEIISVGLDHINPAIFTGPEIEPREFKALLDRGEAVHVLDTRNDYELRVGTFTNAIDLDIRTFRDFPKAIQRLPATMKDEPVVMFCTGGIRCEKASAIMMEAGFTNVMQLKGGVLGYFEEVGGDHWDGDCFVFDQRVAVNPSLEESEVVVCYACREPLSVAEQSSPDYAVGRSCPYCIDRLNLTPITDVG